MEIENVWEFFSEETEKYINRRGHSKQSPMIMESIGKLDGIKCVSYWDDTIHGFRIEVSKGEKMLKGDVDGCWEPRFGVDSMDMYRIDLLIEKLILDLEK